MRFRSNHTEEAKRKMSESKKGKPSHRKGKRLPEEHKKRISETMLKMRIKRSDETRKKMSEAEKQHHRKKAND